jgi:hypothetical protein
MPEELSALPSSDVETTSNAIFIIKQVRIGELLLRVARTEKYSGFVWAATPRQTWSRHKTTNRASGSMVGLLAHAHVRKSARRVSLPARLWISANGGSDQPQALLPTKGAEKTRVRPLKAANV